ncbi:MAG: PaaX family transcriptional regulator C-terminal domain-containing protein [Bacteroidota bacterium]
MQAQNIIYRFLVQKEEVSLKEIIELGGRIKKTEHSIRASVNRLVRDRFLIKMKKNGDLYYKLSKEGERKIQVVVQKHVFIDSQISDDGSVNMWDGSWTVVVFGFPETLRKRRDLFRKELGTLGFAMLFNSTWISPFDKTKQITQIIQTLGIEANVAVFKCPTSHIQCCFDIKKMVYRLWGLKELETKYKNLTRGWLQLSAFLEKKIKQKKKLEARKLFPTVLKLQLDLMDVYFEEPALPKELLPKDWIGLRCHDLTHHVTGLLNKMEFADDYAYLVQVEEVKGIKLPLPKLCGNKTWLKKFIKK